jgi:hypothetical protein
MRLTAELMSNFRFWLQNQEYATIYVPITLTTVVSETMLLGK